MIIRSVRDALSEAGKSMPEEPPAAAPKMHGATVKKSITRTR